MVTGINLDFRMFAGKTRFKIRQYFRNFNLLGFYIKYLDRPTYMAREI